jgi:hypothetical protein
MSKFLVHSSESELMRLVRKSDYLLLLVFLTTFLISTFLNNVLIVTAVQAALIIKALFFRRDYIGGFKGIVIALFLGAEMAFFIFTILYVFSIFIYKLKTPLIRNNSPVFALFMYSLICFFLNSLSQFLPLNFLLWIMIFFGPFAIFFYGQEARQAGVTIRHAYSLVVLVLFLQCVIIFVTGVLRGGFTPGDWASGTFLDAHKLGFVFLFVLVYLTFTLIELKKLKHAVLTFLLLPFLYLCDAKAVVLSAFFAFFLLCLGSIFNVSLARHLINKLIALYLVIFLFFVLVMVNFSGDKVNEFSDLYLHGELTSSKSQMYIKVWSDMLSEHPLNWIVGVGPGSLASKASNMLSGDVLWKQAGGMASKLPISSSLWTQEYMVGLFTSEVVERITHVSAVLTYPFSGLISIKAELGIVGLLIYVYVIFSIIKSSISGLITPLDKTLIFFGGIFIMSLLFDNYHEQIPMIGLYMLILGFHSGNTYNRKEHENTSGI